MLNDKVYLWMCIIACLALITAGALAWVELEELKDPTFANPQVVFQANN